MSFKSKNYSYMFNKEYYHEVTNADGSAKNKDDIKSVNLEFISSGVTLENRVLGNHSINLQVQYPGLLIGIGNSHSSAAKDGSSVVGEIGLGFTFDYVTGVPYIPGSSVKGVIRSAFELGNGEYIRTCLGNPTINVNQLRDEIFEGIKSNEEIPTCERDIFFDAFPSPNTPKENSDNLFYLMELDVISPHHNNPFAEPIPLSLIKVKPGVVFDFAFTLHDGLISAEEKLSLFKQILLDLGIGAKTNVGYGLLREINENFKISAYEKTQPKQSRPSSTSRPEGKVCPNCGAFNFKYMKDSNKIRYNFEKNICHKCGGKLI